MKLIIKLFVLVLLSVTFFVPVTFAKGSQRPVHVILEQSETINKDYFASGDTVTISGIINGDAYVAGGNVTLDGSVNGDLFIAGGIVTIRGKVNNDLRAVGGNITIAGPIGGNVTIGGGNTNITSEGSIAGSLLAGAGNLELFGPVGKGITAGVGNLIVNAPVGGDALLGVGQLTMQPKARVAGNLTYFSEEVAVFQGTATVAGELTYHYLPENNMKSATIGKKGFTAMAGIFAGMAVLVSIAGVITLFVLGLVLIALLPTFSSNVIAHMQKNPWQSFGLGIVITIILPILGITALVTVIGIPIGIFLFLALSLLCLTGHIYAARFIGNGVFHAVKADVHHAWHLLIGLTLLAMLTFIPIIGWLTRWIVVTVAIGAFIAQKSAVYRQMRIKHLV